MQHHLKVHFLPQAQFYNSKIMVPLYFSKKILRKRHFVSRLINTKLSCYLSLLCYLDHVYSTIKTLNKFYNNKISALTTKQGCWVCNLSTHMLLRHTAILHQVQLLCSCEQSGCWIQRHCCFGAIVATDTLHNDQTLNSVFTVIKLSKQGGRYHMQTGNHSHPRADLLVQHSGTELGFAQL